MSVMLPTNVAHILQWLGFEWPEGDEDKVFSYGQRWLSFAGELDSVSGLGNQGAQGIVGENKGPGVEAFRARFANPDGPQATAKNLSSGSNLAGGVIMVIGGAIIALKVVVVVQVVQFAITLAEAIAAAVPTFGASMSIVPIAELFAQKAIQFAINFGIDQLLGGGGA